MELISKLLISFICTTAAPNMAGMDNKKLNLAANSLLRPEKSPADIVAPNLDIPGAIAMAWNIPITIAFFNVMSSTSLWPVLTLSAPHNRNPVISRNMPT